MTQSDFTKASNTNSKIFKALIKEKAVDKGKRSIVINGTFGGFGLSEKAYKKLGLTWDGYGYLFDKEKFRDCRVLVDVVKKLKGDADGAHAELKVVVIPEDVKWQLESYDGAEWIAEKHRIWR